jgi:AbrB family looped-hinge helix DNA binding protein
MYTSTISTKYQVVIPSEVRKEFNIKPGQKITFIPYKKTLRLMIVPPIEEAFGLLKGMQTSDFREDDDEER